MFIPTVHFTRLNHSGKITVPRYQSPGAAGMDLQADVLAPVILQPGARMVIPCGIKLAISFGYEGQLRPRSGLAARWGITLLNAPGTIDCDYRGEINAILLNTDSETPFKISPGDRIAQLVIAPVVQATMIERLKLPSTERGEAGFGSTGV